MTPQEAKQLARELFLKTLPHLDVGAKMRESMRLRDGVLEIAGERIPLHAGKPVRVIAIGKAAIEMAHTLAELLPEVRLRGVVAAPSEPRVRLPGFEYFQGGHPYPNEQSWQAAEAALALLDHRNVAPDDLVIFLISGGGSALMEKPLDPAITLVRLQQFYQSLVGSGASIGEINTLRKHFSMVKGGRLAQVAAPARQLTLFVSDVPEHQPAMIASGPTMPDDTTLLDCKELLDRPELQDRLAAFRDSFTFNANYHEPTPKAGDRWFARSHFHCLLANWNAVEKLAELAEQAGVIVETDSRCDDWHYQKAADYLLDRLRSLRKENPDRAVAIISGGELSSQVLGNGIGGRNQAFVLDCVMKIAGTQIAVLSCGTDGVDGNSPAAGAVADGDTLFRALKMKMDSKDYQQRSDSYHYFDQLGDTIVTGPTGTNVRDLRLLLAY